jgi:hypothetical protein
MPATSASIAAAGLRRRITSRSAVHVKDHIDQLPDLDLNCMLHDGAGFISAGTKSGLFRLVWTCTGPSGLLGQGSASGQRWQAMGWHH